MKGPAFTFALILAYAGIAVFGAVAMTHGGGEGHVACIAATARETVSCLAGNGSPFAFVAFHLSAFKSFSTAIFGSPLAAVIALIAVAVFFALGGAAFFGSVAAPAVAFALHRRGQRKKLSFASRRNFMHWLALLEKRDPATLR